MLPDERMVEAVAESMRYDDECVSTALACSVGEYRDDAREALKRAFAALDREALIEAAALGVADAEHWPHGTPHPTDREREFARRALVAVGLIA